MEAKVVDKGSFSNRAKWMTECMKRAADKSIPTKILRKGSKPFWDEEMKTLAQRRNTCRRDMKEHREEWMRLNREMTEKMIEKKRQIWRKYVEEMPKGADNKDVWRTISRLDGKNTSQAKAETVIVGGIEYVSNKE